MQVETSYITNWYVQTDDFASSHVTVKNFRSDEKSESSIHLQVFEGNNYN